MKSTCISHPASERLVIIRKWQVEFCDGNQCAAALLSFFEYWHSWKLNSDRYNRKSNDIAELHGEPRSLAEDVYQYHSLNEMSAGILNLYGAKAIGQAIKLLESKLCISIHANPNPRFHYDKTKYFKFYPDICNEWIKTSYKSGSSQSATSIPQKGVTDTAKVRNASGENTSPYGENTVYRTEINNKEINQSINTPDNFLEDPNQKPGDKRDDIINTILEALVEKGMHADRFYQDSIAAITQLCASGATVSQFIEGYDIAANVTKSGNFGANYLVKVVESLLLKSKQAASATIPKHSTTHERVASDETVNTVFESNLVNGESWLSD